VGLAEGKRVGEAKKRAKKKKTHDSTMIAGLSNIYPHCHPITNTM
jgi:hypothetical protein